MFRGLRPLPPAGVVTRWATPENPLAEPGQGGSTHGGRKGRAHVPMERGGTLVRISSTGRPGVVRRIWLTIPDRSPALLRGEAWWDDAPRPAINAALGDIHGVGLGLAATFESASFANPECSSFVCTLPMPFRRAMRIALLHESDRCTRSPSAARSRRHRPPMRGLHRTRANPRPTRQRPMSNPHLRARSMLSRTVLRLPVTLALVTAAPAASKAADRPRPEVAASVYAWELHDEGTATVVDNLVSLAAVNSLYLISPMHPEPRPHGGERFPHNPARQRHLPDDAAVYFPPDASLYGRLAPARPAEPWLRDRDYLAELVAAARAHGLKVGAEISHAYLPERLLFLPENADLLQRDLRGEPVGMYWLRRAYCPNHPDVRAFLRALVADLASGRDLDFVQTCLLVFVPGEPDRAGCFCRNCAERASASGVDWDALVAALRADPKNPAAHAEWLSVRRDSVVSLYAELHAALKAANPRVEFRLNHHDREEKDWAPGTVQLLKPSFDSIRLSDYAEQTPANTARAAAKPVWIDQTRALVGPDYPIIAGVGLRGEATDASIRAGIKTSLAHGVQGLSLGHYDGATFASLRTVRAGLIDATAPDLEPAAGVSLAGLPPLTRRTRDFAGGSGIAAVHDPDATGRTRWEARYVFPHATGRYALRFTVADLPGGAATITAARADGTVLGELKLDRDTDCWLLRETAPVTLTQGETLILTGHRDAADWALAEHLEFRPR